MKTTKTKRSKERFEKTQKGKGEKRKEGDTRNKKNDAKIIANGNRKK